MLYKVTHVTVTLLRWISMLQLECRLNVTSNCSFWFCPVFLTYTIYKINQVNQLFDLYIFIYKNYVIFLVSILFTKDHVLSHTIDVQFSTLQWNGINSFSNLYDLQTHWYIRKMKRYLWLNVCHIHHVCIY